MNRTKAKPPRGIVMAPAATGGVEHERIGPRIELVDFVEHFWTVRWNLDGQPAAVGQTLPHPSVHCVVEGPRHEVLGIHKTRFERRLEGHGRVFAVKFRPAMFASFLPSGSMQQLAQRRVRVREVFGEPGARWGKAIAAEPNLERCIECTEAFLLERLPARDALAVQLRDLVERLAVDRDLVRVEQVAALAGVTVRTLQRQFERVVGVSPKWVLQRYRLHEAMVQLEHDPRCSIASLAASLGYTDQAHFTHDFKELLGVSPAAYAARARP